MKEVLGHIGGNTSKANNVLNQSAIQSRSRVFNCTLCAVQGRRYKAHETDQDLGLMTRHVVGAWCMVDRNGVLTDSMF